MKEEEVVISVLTIQGLVQGAGFRPFIYRIASEMNICGEVDNRNNGVCIRTALTPVQRELFIERIRREHPKVASIHRITVSERIEVRNPYMGFRITPSRSESDEVMQVAPDIAVCPECLRDRKTQAQRLQYPFVNCAHCGPRFSIIRDLPYDRSRTTMSAFSMCPSCRKEYITVSDRRFHAEPVACNHCGPSYYALYNKVKVTDYSELLNLSSRLLREGEVIAAKGIGGYHLICDARSEKAVSRLRDIKQRDGMPFAVLFRDIENIRRYVFSNGVEEKALLSWRRPIVLLKQLRLLASSVNPGMETLGCMLPYMPLHSDWFERLDTPALVMTSGNISECPITITPEEAEKQLAGKIPLLLHHNRVEDSVLQVCGGQSCLIRRSRGYVPEPSFADVPVEGILAFGAEKVNTFALGKGETILQSQYIGDLKNWETFRFYKESLERFQHLFRFRPFLLVCDLHPDYLSSAGRLFDAVSSLLGVCDVSTHQAEAPVKLEQLASDEHQSRYSVLIEKESISMCPVLEGILEDLAAGVPVTWLSARFHNTLAWLLVEMAKQYRMQTGTDKVVISGGCFQNKRLTEQLQRMFAEAGIPLFVPGHIPCNDGGVAVGQLAIAASRKRQL